MQNIPLISFSAGELSPKIDARSDMEKYQSGCRHLDNMIPRIYGPVERRPGLKFIFSTEPPKQGLYEYCDNPTTSESRFYCSLTIIACQTITPQISHYITGFKIYWFKFNSPAGNLHCRVETTVWNPTPGVYEPSGTILETSGTSYDISKFPTESPYSLCNFVFDGTTRLVAGTTYALVFYNSDFVGNPVYHYVVSRGRKSAASGDGYTRGASGFWNTSAWVYLDSEEDCWFEETGALTTAHLTAG